MAGRSQFGPAAGTRQGAAPLPAMLHVPDLIALDRHELDPLLRVIRSPVALHAYLVMRTQADFSSGHCLLDDYARLMELLTEPQPERGRRVPGPTYEQLRRALRLLESYGLIRRDAGSNAAQGQLRVYLPHVERRATEFKQRHARTKSQQGLAQGQTARKAA